MQYICIIKLKQQMLTIMETYFKFQGNIEGEKAICNIAENCQFSAKPSVMVIPAHHCTEYKDVISIEKKLFNKLKRNNLIEYK